MKNNTHYSQKDSNYEPYKVISKWNLNFNLGNVIKYVVRAGKKKNNSLEEDLLKAKQYIDFELEMYYNNKDNEKQ